jgi:site-specific recombinase XerC
MGSELIHGHDAHDDRALRRVARVAGEHALFHASWVQTWSTTDLAHARDRHVITLATWGSYTRALWSWVRHLEAVRTDRPTPETVQAWVASMPTRSPLGMNSLLTALRAFYRWTASTDRFPNLMETVHNVPVVAAISRPDRAVLSEAELAAAIDRLGDSDPRSLRDRALLWTLASDLETISLVPARIRDVDLDAGTFIHHPRGSQDQPVLSPLRTEAVLALRTWLACRPQAAASAPLFIRFARHIPPVCRGNGTALSALSMRLTVLRTMQVAGHAKRLGAEGHYALLSPGHYGSDILRRSVRHQRARTTQR